MDAQDAHDEGANARHGPKGTPSGPESDGSPAFAPRIPAPASGTPSPPGYPGAPGTFASASADETAPVPPGTVPPGTVPPSTVPPSTELPGTPASGAAPVGMAALSLRYQIVAALALAVVAVAAVVHLGMVFLHVAPSNTVTKQHGRAIDEWIYPEFEQNWKLFAPNPLQQNIAVQVRAEVRTPDGARSTTGWYDLSARDGAAIDGNLLPSHTQQNELRRAWDFYVGTHDNDNRPAGLRGDLSERYLRRIAVLRLDRARAGGDGAVVERVQFRSRTTNVPAPKWSEEQVSDEPLIRELPWWTVSAGDLADLTEAGTEDRTEAGAP
ncbi:DUF5819 family protein [Streptomyces sp. NPDC008313]|uniref:DUF5819 family protein n=1 Tax=Streptomyces sp. NPDC008313 TaxID=3364826 RepID=UPI0036EEB5F3